MDLDAQAPLRALGGTLSSSLALIDPGAGGIGPVVPAAPVPQNPAEVLAALMDFAGSVALAELLAAEPATGPSHPQAAQLGETLLREVRARLDSLLPLALKPLVGRRAPSPPPADALLALLRTHTDDTARPSPDAALRIAAELGAPLQSALATSLRQAQAHVATLRWEIAHELRALGPRADRLERIDAALQRSIQAKIGELLDRMEHAGMLTFERACQRACESLPDEPTEEALARWVVESGWIERYRERCVRMTRALYGHLRRSLDGLLRAAIHAESAP
jgi:hypothetical protein